MREDINVTRQRFALLPRTDRSDRMVGDISRGVAKEDSPAVVDEQDGRMWDALARELKANNAKRGGVVFLDID